MLALISLILIILIFWNRSRIIHKAKKAIFHKNNVSKNFFTKKTEISNKKGAKASIPVQQTISSDILKAIRKIKILLDHNQYKEAEKKLIAILAVNQTCLEANILLASIYLKKKQYGRAEIIYKRIIDFQKNKDAKILSNLAFCLFEQNKIKKSISYYEKALEIEPDNVKRYTNLAQVLFVVKDFMGAIKLFKKAVKMKPRDTEILFMLADTYREAQKYNDAKKTYLKILDYEPYNVEAKQEINNFESMGY